MSYYYSILEAQMKAQEEEEKKKKKEEAIKKTDEERKKEKDTEPVKSVNERIKQKKAVKENYINFKADVNDFLLETFLYTIVDKAMTKTAVTENTDNFRRGLIHEYVTTNGFYRIMDKMRTQNTLFLSESVKFIEEYASLITENADEDDIETHAIDHNNREEFYKDLDDESIESIADIIRRRVSQSTEEFMNKNIVDDINIKDIMMDTKEKIDNIRTGDNALDEEIKQEYTILAKKKLQAIESRPRSVFEQIVYNISEAALRNEDIYMEYANKDGMLNMDKIVDTSTALYTFFETLNTLKIEDFNEQTILEAIKFQ